MNVQVVSFDAQGTLFDDIPQWYRAVRAIFHHHNKAPPTLTELYKSLQVGWMKIYEDAGIDITSEEQKIYTDAYRSRIETIEPATGASDVLRTLKERGIIVHLLTSQPMNLMLPLLKKFDWKYSFDNIIPGSSDKAADLILKAARHCKKKGDVMLYVGDTPGDMSAAASTPCVYPVHYVNGYWPDAPQNGIRRLSEVLDVIDNISTNELS